MNPQVANLDANIPPGEKVLWRGKPVRTAFVYRTWPLSVFGAVLLTGVLAYEIIVLTTEAPDLLAVWGVPFVLAALYMAVGHFLVTSLEWQNTEYVVTERRLLVKHGVFSPDLRVFSLIALPHTTLEMHGDDIGNIMFKPAQGEGYGPWPGYQTMWPYTPGYLLGLLYIRDPQKVQGLIESARQG